MRNQSNPCKYGSQCKFLSTGNCRYFHEGNTFQKSNLNQNSFTYRERGGFQNNQYAGNRSRSKGRQQYGNNQHTQQNYNQLQKNSNGHFSEGGTLNQNLNHHICRQFHQNSQCKYGQTCKKKHEYILNRPQALRRLYFNTDIPNNSISRLIRIPYEDKLCFGLRLGNEVFFFEYKYLTNEILSMQSSFVLPGENLKYIYYNQKDNFIFYSAQNQTTKYYDIGFYDLKTQQYYWIANSHTNKVTSIVNYSQDIMISTSIDGQLKFWAKDQKGTFYLQPQLTNNIKNMFNPQSIKLELNFADVYNFNETKILSVGTNDGRLFLFIGHQLLFKEIVFSKEQHKNVFKINYIFIDGNINAVILAWDINKMNSSLIMLSLEKMQFKVVKTVESKQNEKQNIHHFLFIESYLLISNFRGEVNIYQKSNLQKRVGIIFQQNYIEDMIGCEVSVKQTGVNLNFLFILQKKIQQSRGSLGIYLMK